MSNIADGVFSTLAGELNEAITMYWETAASILEGSGILLLDPPADYLSMENNFFSALFLYSYHRVRLPPSRRVLYAAINQCLRGMVTGCDNILDDEYKATLRTSLPGGAKKFRSVLDIMVSDRVLFALVTRACWEETLTRDQVLAASSASLRALTESGAQEATEEMGVDRILEPNDVLRRVHHYKTGKLFLCPWGVPETVEVLDEGELEPVKKALYRVGIGCQIMDDMVDLRRDALEKRHNYVASLIFHGTNPAGWERFLSMVRSERPEDEDGALLEHFPEAKRAAATAARERLESGLKGLFFETHQFLVEPCLDFLCERIGTTHLMGA